MPPPDEVPLDDPPDELPPVVVPPVVVPPVVPPDELPPVVVPPEEELPPVVVPPVVVPDELPIVPPSGGGGGGGGTYGVHVPWMEPGGAMHGRPVQQSAFVVQDWPAIWQEVALHWSPFGPATHGL